MAVPVMDHADTGIGQKYQNANTISALWFSTSMGTFHYRNWDSTMVTVPVMVFVHFGSLSVLARVITGTGIQWCPFRYWHFGTFI
jgi:hypothetical protein